MLIKRKRGWEMPESAATPESVYLRRRELIKTIAAGSVLAAAGILPVARARAEEIDLSAKLYPIRANDKYKLDRPLTDEKYSTQYNNFYEFGDDKYIWKDAQKLPIRPWTVKIDGMVEKPFEIGIDDLLAKMPLETRLYRHRCVEAWSMAVPWSGFPLKALVDLARPLSSATFLQMQTFMDPKVSEGQRDQLFYPWPYTEGLAMAEATNELAFIATGMYGHPIPKQNGAPLRLATPWKYGFKSIKSIVSFTFTDKRPTTFWEKLGPSEYGFWANVNPDVPHPRWSQATEKVLGTGERVPTLLYNGYGEYVADIYKNMPIPKDKLFM